MTPSKLGKGHTHLALDASVLINVLGTGSPLIVFRALKRRIAIDRITLREVTIDPSTRRPCKDIIDDIQRNGFIEIVQMQTEARDHFLRFVGATPPDDLDDGEAATLAHAATGGYVAVIDERKATRIASLYKPKIQVLNTVDLLLAPELIEEIGLESVSELVFKALRDARMRVPRDLRLWVAELLGESRVRQCPSLGLSRRPDS